MHSHGHHHLRRTFPSDLVALIDLLNAKADAIATLLNLVNETVGAIAKANESGAASFSIPTFCRRNDLSHSQYFKLRREGRGPRTMSTGNVGVRISRQAEADWIAEREREREQLSSPSTTIAEKESR